MPAKSKSQQSVFGLALAARRGDIESDSLFGAAKRLFFDKSLSNDDLSDYASTKARELPKRAVQQQNRTFKRT